jgi:competence protein ComEC
VGRRSDSLHVLGILFWMSALAQPWSLLDSGCRLSYLAAGGLVVAARVTAPLQRRFPARWRWLPLGVAATLGSTWFTLPDTAASFGWLNLLAPLANLVAVPLFTAIVWMGTLALIAERAWPWLARALYGDTWLLARLLEAGAGACDRVRPALIGIPALGPGRIAGILVISLAIGVTLRRLGGAATAAARRQWLALLALLAGLLILLLPLGRVCRPGRMTAVQFAVGQGDAAVLVFPDHSVVLLDTGPAAGSSCAFVRNVAPWLLREAIHDVAAVVLTHGHDDHTSGAIEASRRLAVGDWWIGGTADRWLPPGLPPERVSRPRAGDVVHAGGGWSLVCLHAEAADDSTLNENNHSVTLGLCRGCETVAVWSGDLEREGEANLLADPENAELGAVQLWKAGHHGSRTSGSAPFLARIHPRLVVASCGLANRHRHPSHGPFVAAGDTLLFLRTDRDGSFVFRWDAAGTLEWRSARGERGCVPRVESPPAVREDGAGQAGAGGVGSPAGSP